MKSSDSSDERVARLLETRLWRQRLAERNERSGAKEMGRKVEKTKKNRKEVEREREYGGGGGFIQRFDLYSLENKKKERKREKCR